MALIWLGLRKTGIAATVVEPWVIDIETPERVVGRGKARVGEVAGPRLAPKIETWAPWGMPPDGSPGGRHVAGDVDDAAVINERGPGAEGCGRDG
jgi:hypothetical protein